MRADADPAHAVRGRKPDGKPADAGRVVRWDRAAIFGDVADAAADTGLPYWLILLLSTGIATLGLALDSAGVVIGAMVVAPLLSPISGLALSLAAGDGRLAVQMLAVVLASSLAVIFFAAGLTALLPFTTVTAEIAARTRPTTLDLVIAVFSGLTGAVVAVFRRSRLTAALPGVAIAVALVPPLSVAGFGVGMGWNWPLIRGSLLLYGANFAGIVLSSVAVFLAVGMARPDVVRVAARWHRRSHPSGLAALTERLPWVRSIRVFRSPTTRVAPVLVFALLVSIPLSETLAEIARETRVQRAVERAAHRFAVPGRSFILGRQLTLGTEQSEVRLRIATTEWFGAEAREAFEREASAAAGEAIRVVLEQLPASTGDLEQLARLIPRAELRPPLPAAPSAPASLDELLASARTRVRDAIGGLPLPDSTAVIGFEVLAADGSVAAARVDVAYLAPLPLPETATQILARALTAVLGTPEPEVRLTHISQALRQVGRTAPDTAALRDLAETLSRYHQLGVEIHFGPAADSLAAERVLAELMQRGVDPRRVVRRPTERPGIAARLIPQPAATPGPSRRGDGGG